eukprot:3941947-Rhodomonas_salina.2
MELPAYSRATRCPVLTSRMCYQHLPKMDTMGKCDPFCALKFHVSWPTSLRACYAMPGTNVAYLHTRALCDARY